jgi:integrase
MKGSMRRRGQRSWELKFDLGTDENGKRKIAYRSVKGTRSEAEAKLTEYVAQLGRGDYVTSSKETVATFMTARIEAWATTQQIGAKTAERYREILAKHIVPGIGNVMLQKLTGLRIGEWHGELLAAGLAVGTVRVIHGVVAKALKEAHRNGLVNRNAANDVSPPPAEEREVTILQPDKVPMVMALLQERGDDLGAMAAIALYAGLRRGEVLALRWNAIDLDARRLSVVCALEELRDGTITVKKPKTKAGRRAVTMPEALVATLRAHRVKQMQVSLKLGLGRLPDDALLFSNLDGSHVSPRAISHRWLLFADKAGVGDVRFHDLRHTQASLLHDAKVPLAVVSKRLGHSKITTTLNLYTHIFETADGEAATALDGVLGGRK